MMLWTLVIVAAVVVYVFSSGIAFVIMYKVPRISPRIPTVAYAPLEVLARRSRMFGRLYTGFHWWMYRRLVHNYQHDGPPPPPPSLSL